MIVIAKDAEKIFLEDLRHCRDETPSQRCFYIAFSKLGMPKGEMLEYFIQNLHDVPNAYKAQVYICHDKDVFILMNGFMQRQFMEFLIRLSEDLKAGELLRLADVTEVGIHWDKLQTMCQRKIEALENEKLKETEQKKKELAEHATLDVLTRLDPNLVASIADRRQNRSGSMIMVVDDDQISRTLVGNVVKEHHDCVYAKDGQGALMQYVESAPDVMFLDIGLPDIDGHTVLECLFQIDPSAYIIMFSGRKDRQNILRALEAGAQGFIGKPFTREKLYEYIARSGHIRDKQGGRPGIRAG